MNLSQKNSLYSSMLPALESGISNLQGNMLICKITVDFLPKVPYLQWIVIYFFNLVSKEFYLGYNIGKSTTRTIVRYDELKFPFNRFDERIAIISDIEAEYTDTLAPLASLGIDFLIKKDGKILGMIVTGSESENAFNDADRKYLVEIADTVSDEAYHHKPAGQKLK